MNSIKRCIKCQVVIPEERLEILPDTEHCVKCSDVSAPIGFMVYGHKTAPQLVLIDPKDKESLRLAQNANRRKR